MLRKIEPYFFITPAIIIILIIFAYPVLRLSILSFQRPSEGSMVFAGFTNYLAIMRDCTYTQVGVWSANSLDRTVVVAVYGHPR